VNIRAVTCFARPGTIDKFKKGVYGMLNKVIAEVVNSESPRRSFVGLMGGGCQGGVSDFGNVLNIFFIITIDDIEEALEGKSDLLNEKYLNLFNEFENSTRVLKKIKDGFYEVVDDLENKLKASRNINERGLTRKEKQIAWAGLANSVIREFSIVLSSKIVEVGSILEHLGTFYNEIKDLLLEEDSKYLREGVDKLNLWLEKAQEAHTEGNFFDFNNAENVN
jgi:hypothetical protein